MKDSSIQTGQRVDCTFFFVAAEAAVCEEMQIGLVRCRDRGMCPAQNAETGYLNNETNITLLLRMQSMPGRTKT